MGWMEFVSRVIDSLAWPLAVVALVFLLRRRIEALLAGQLRRLKAGPGGLELEWDRVIAEARSGTEWVELEESAPGAPPMPRVPIPSTSLRAELESLARDRPRDAVLEAHRRVEAELRRLVESRVPMAADAPDAVSLAGLAAAHKLINVATLQSLEGLNVLRNLATHREPDGLSPGRAMEYLDLADGTLYALRSQIQSEG